MVELARFLAVVAAVAFLLALALTAFVVARRTARLLAQSRERELFRRSVRDLVDRIATSLDGVGTRVDLVRRQSLEADAIEENLAAATDAVERYVAEARALPGSGTAAEIRAAIVADLERAGRALQMVEHGCSILGSARGSGRELEAQTSIKRGYLNILHAREAITRHGARTEEWAAADVPRVFPWRNA